MMHSATSGHYEGFVRFPVSVRCLGGAPRARHMISGAIAVITAFAPKNEMEAALAVQAACTHMVAMVIMARIGGGHGTDRRLPGMASAAAKLLRAYCTQIETHRRLRGGGEQKIIVKHVTVNEGGQAIVGAVTTRAKA